ncbi:M23 family metallopeptidase [Caldinitratiruptor microaerophilus]|uniref:Murein DD-endopeptidase MepM and murein hydrolase activator NlpD, contain LysM domain n=1 Tax=Caldinitratiruptor microaerophilus TaxID=671077 RepID=A0AA35CNR5_9FIRM|nr:M23 family metallopeptidase [Caldinitratiruptor microaerophilus]BDG61823.1 hypothetical protein caldi_29130 [Caldinitratiruptor microaerophilus]
MKPRPAVLGATAAAAALALAAWGLSLARGAPSAEPSPPPTRSLIRVEYGGEPVGYVADRTVVDEAVSALLAGIPPEGRAPVDPRPRLRTEAEAAPASTPVLDSAGLAAALRAFVPDVTKAWMLTVDGREVVPVRTREDAERVLATIRDDYLQRVLREASRVDQVRIVGSIGFVERWVPASAVRTPEQAAEVLRFGTDRKIFYTVSRGDTLWDIARTRGVSVDDLVTANPEIDPDRLQPGQQISLTVREPYIHIESTETQVYEEEIPFPEHVVKDPDLWPWESRVIEPGRPGRREVTARVERRDGQVVRREIVSTRLLAEPRPARVARGTRQAPKLGTGKLCFPVNGQITSGFGYRRRDWHPGIDIAAPKGTPVHAADAGTVTFVGWDAGYGLTVRVDHGGGNIVTVYAHLSSAAVRVGETVERGQVIGQVGSTGRSTGPHLHFEVRLEGRPANPLDFYP